MSRTISSSYLATLFASAVVFHTQATEALEKVAAQPDPSQQLLELIRDVGAKTGTEFPAESLAAIEAKVALKPLRLDAARKLTANLLSAAQRDLAQAQEDGESEVFVTEDGYDLAAVFGPSIDSAGLAELEAIHVVVEAEAQAVALLERAEAGLRSAAEFGEQTSGITTLTLQ